MNEEINKNKIIEGKVELTFLNEDGTTDKKITEYNTLTNTCIFDMMMSQINLQNVINDDTSGDNGETTWESNNLFSQICLTNAGEEEDARNTLIKGAEVGKIDIDNPNTQTDSLYGYSLYSTSYRDGSISLDGCIPSTKINNKEFDTIWVKPSPNNNNFKSGTNFAFRKIGYMNNIDGFYNYVRNININFKIVDGKIYFFDIEYNNKTISLVQKKVLSFGDSSINNFAILEDNTIILRGDSYYYVKKINTDLTITSLKKIEINDDNYTDTIVGIGSYIYGTKTGSNSYGTEKIIKKFDINMNILKTYTIITEADEYIDSRLTVLNNKFLCFTDFYNYNNYTYILNPESEDMSKIAGTWAFSPLYYRQPLICAGGDLYLCRVNASNQNYLGKKYSKQEGQALKISYKLNVQE